MQKKSNPQLKQEVKALLTSMLDTKSTKTQQAFINDSKTSVKNYITLLKLLNKKGLETLKKMAIDEEVSHSEIVRCEAYHHNQLKTIKKIKKILKAEDETLSEIALEDIKKYLDKLGDKTRDFIPPKKG